MEKLASAAEKSADSEEIKVGVPTAVLLMKLLFVGKQVYLFLLTNLPKAYL